MDQPATAALTPPVDVGIDVDRGAARDDLGARIRARALGRRIWQRYVTDVRAETNARAETARATTAAAVLDRRAGIVLVTTAICLTITNFLAAGNEPGWLASPLRAIGLDGTAGSLERALAIGGRAELYRLAFWALVQIGGYLALPLLVTRFVLRMSFADIGLRARGIARHFHIYAALYACAFPFVYLASFTDAFQAKYPFYDLAVAESLWPRMYVWWALYGLQFLALELFFRGFLLHGLVPRLGYASLFVMIVPYNMIHYGKPMPEALVAIVGGLVLGSLSLKTRSIWWGAALHCAIAATMDLLALWHAGVVF